MSMAIAEDPQGSQATEVVESDRPQAIADGVRPAQADPAADHRAGKAQARLDLSEPERRLLRDLFAIVSEHGADSSVEIDRERVQDAFVFACEHHAAQRGKSGEDFSVPRLRGE